MQPCRPHSSARILIADDHALVRYGLRKLIGADSNYCCVGEAANGEEALNSAKKLRPDVLLLDDVMPKLSGIQILQRLSDAHLHVRTILLMSTFSDFEVSQAIARGARGIFYKTTSTELLLKSIRCVLEGQVWIDRATLTGLITHVGHSRHDLTDREKDVVSAVASGSCNKVIADRFTISEKTVKRHLVNIFDKLGVSSRLELAVFAMHHGLGPHGFN